MERVEMLNFVRERAQLWLNDTFDSDTRDKVRFLMENDENELIESFYRNLEFGTGGLRGLMGVGTNRMNIYTVSMATQGLSNYLLIMFGGLAEIKVVIGYDCRNNSRLFAETSAKVFSANGIYVLLFDDLRPTPEISFAIRHYKCQSGIIITASHNPKEYNGYKAYWDDGGQIIYPHDDNIINEVAQIESLDKVKLDSDISKIKYLGNETDEIYTDLVRSLSVHPSVNQKYHDLKIVYTPIHGTGVKLVPMALRKFGFTSIYNVPEQDITDGNFPTVKSPNPEEAAALELALKKARKVGAVLVMATDPDGDRVGVAVKDKDGELKLLNGNQVASLLIYYLIDSMAKSGKLHGNEFICKTIVTTDLLNVIADEAGVMHFDVLTGFKYIADIIKRYEGKLKFIAGGEESYGYLVGDFVRDKDAVISCCLIAEITAWAKSQGKSLFDILADIYIKYGYYKESLISVVKKGKEGLEEISRMMENFRNHPPEIINGSKVIKIIDYEKGISLVYPSKELTALDFPKSNVLQFLTEDETKISIRPSGTEPKIKFYFSVREKLINKDDYHKISKKLDAKIDSIVQELSLK